MFGELSEVILVQAFMPMDQHERIIKIARTPWTCIRNIEVITALLR